MKIEQTPGFRKDFKKLTKKHFQVSKLKDVVAIIIKANHDLLLTRYKDHALKGEWQGYRELHIEADWLLIYKIEQDELILTLTRTGSHNELFR